MDTEKTIPEMLREYNTLAAQAAALGLAYRERKCFKDRKDAARSLEMVQSSLRAARSADKPDAGPAAAPVINPEPTPAVEAAGNQEEAPVAKTAKTKRTAKAKANGNGHDGPRKGSKMEVLHRMLTRKSGCTRKQILDETGWKAVSVQQICEGLGLKIKMAKEKGSPTTYWGE